VAAIGTESGEIVVFRQAGAIIRGPPKRPNMEIPP
jgi:hypothetical protein